jgi:hypothetical protein
VSHPSVRYSKGGVLHNDETQCEDHHTENRQRNAQFRGALFQCFVMAHAAFVVAICFNRDYLRYATIAGANSSCPNYSS